MFSVFSIVRPFTLKFFMLLAALSVAMSIAIYGKQSLGLADFDFAAVLLWQLAIWLPWAAAPFVIERASESLDQQSRIKKLLGFFLVMVGLLILHFSLFFGLSRSLSPLLDFPGTRFGVYSFFFIFWTIIDVIFLWAISLRLRIPDAVSDPPEEQPKEEISTVIPVKKGNAVVLIRPEEINWISAEDYYAKLHTAKGEFLVRKPLKILLRELSPKHFVQIHRSTIVNIAFVSEVKKDEAGNHLICLKNGRDRAVSPAGYKRLKSAISGKTS